jgi:hypothetical protein
MENMSIDDLGLLLGVVEILVDFQSLFMAFNSSCCNVTSSPNL